MPPRPVYPMRRAAKIGLVALAAGLVGAGCWQYAMATQLEVSVSGAEKAGSAYGLQLKLDNPSLLYLSAGPTEFVVLADGRPVGSGTLSPFVLPGLDSVLVDGTFRADGGGAQGSSEIKISGTTEYDLLLTTVEVPFVLYPTSEQASEFIDSS